LIKRTDNLKHRSLLMASLVLVSGLVNWWA
jgi:hypothetical protein